jgi:hypothetical protein
MEVWMYSYKWVSFEATFVTEAGTSVLMRVVLLSLLANFNILLI